MKRFIQSKTIQVFVLIIILLINNNIGLGQPNQDTEILEWLNNNDVEGTMNSNHISSDFGRRETSSGANMSRWHKGIDITPEGGDGDLGYPIKSIVAGRVKYIRNNNYYKYIIIEDENGNKNFGYGHIFRDNQSTCGDFAIVPLTSDDDYTAIVYNNGTENYAITDMELPNGEHNEYLVYNGTTYNYANNNLHNRVEPGDIIAPIGNSGGFQGAAHIHLYLIDDVDANDRISINNCKNPLVFLQHQRPVLDIEISDVRNNYANNLGGKIHNFNIKVEVEFNAQELWSGYNGQYEQNGPILDIDAVEVSIRKHGTGNSFELIKGAYFDAKMCNGGTFDEWSVRYPQHNLPTGNTSGGDPNTVGVDISQSRRTNSSQATWAGFGDYRKNGIQGRAYSSTESSGASINFNNGHQDDYYFTDFPTRIHKNDNFGRNNILEANNNEEARYPDGIYDLKAEVWTVTSALPASYTNQPTEIIIDNFAPYIESVQVLVDGSSTPFYSSRWVPTGDGSTINADTKINGRLWPGDGFTLLVKASEELTGLNVTIPGINTTNDYFPMTRSYTEPNTWFLHITSRQSSKFEETYTHPFYDAQVNLRFEGEDVAGNTLQAFAPHTSLNEQYPVAIRTGENTWTAGARITGDADRWHTFPLGCAPLAIGTKKKRGNESTECVWAQFVDVELGEGYYMFKCEPGDFSSNATHFQWHFGYNNQTATGRTGANDEWHQIYYPPGRYTIILEVYDQYGNYSAYTHELVVEDPDGENIVNFEYEKIEGDMNFRFTDTSVPTPTTWHWTFGDGNESAEQNPDHKFPFAADFQVNLKATFANGETLKKTRWVTVENPAPIGDDDDNKGEGYLDVSCDASEDPFTDNGWTFTINVIDYLNTVGGTYKFELDFGDGNVQCLQDNFGWIMVNHTYTSPGNYSFTVNVKKIDAGGKQVGQDAQCEYWGIYIDGDCTIDADFTINGSNAEVVTVDVGTMVVFDDNTTGSQYEFESWDLTGTGPTAFRKVYDTPGNVTKTFWTSGTYAIKLNVLGSNPDDPNPNVCWGFKQKTLIVDAGYAEECNENTLTEMNLPTRYNPTASVDINGEYICEFDGSGLRLLPENTSILNLGVGDYAQASRDGDWVIIGNSDTYSFKYKWFGRDIHEYDRGEIFFYHNENGEWIRKAHIEGGSEKDCFGSQVDICGDFAVASEPGAFDEKGRIRLYKLNGTEWSEQKIFPDGTTHFGKDVLLTEDYLFVQSENLTWVFEERHGSYFQDYYIDDANGALFFEIDDGGDVTLMIGRNFYILEDVNGKKKWNKHGSIELPPNDNIDEDEYVIPFKLNNTIAIGAPSYSDRCNGLFAGTVYLYKRSDVTPVWYLQHQLTSVSSEYNQNTAFDYFGSSIGLTEKELLIGGWRSITHNHLSVEKLIFPRTLVGESTSDIITIDKVWPDYSVTITDIMFYDYMEDEYFSFEQIDDNKIKFTFSPLAKGNMKAYVKIFTEEYGMLELHLSGEAYLPETKLSYNYCGQTINSLDTEVTCNPVEGATSYNWRITDGTTPYDIETGNKNFIIPANHSWFEYNKTYQVEIKVKTNGYDQYSDYGVNCLLTMPAYPAPVITGTDITPEGCIISCSPVLRATGYEWNIDEGTVQRLTTNPVLNISDIESLSPDTEYSFTVRARFSNIWGPTSNGVFMPCSSIPDIKLTDAFCGATFNTFDEIIECKRIPSAVSYQLQISHNGTVIHETDGSIPGRPRLPYFSISEMPGIFNYGESYIPTFCFRPIMYLILQILGLAQ